MRRVQKAGCNAARTAGDTLGVIRTISSGL